MSFREKEKTYIIAELSGNHNGSIKNAIESIRAAKRIGANAIKFQTYTPDTMTLNCNSKDFLLSQGTIWDGEYLYDLYKKAFTPWEWHKELFQIAKDEGIDCFSTPFDKTAVDFLESLDNPIYKWQEDGKNPYYDKDGIATDAEKRDIWLINKQKVEFGTGTTKKRRR